MEVFKRKLKARIRIGSVLVLIAAVLITVTRYANEPATSSAVTVKAADVAPGISTPSSSH